MKSQTSLKYFNHYINHEHEHYKECIKRFVVSKDNKLGETYFKLFQLITIYNLKTFNIKRGIKPGKSLVHSEFDIMVEIVRIIDKFLDQCFPQLSRETFIETFLPILYINKNSSMIIYQDDPPKSPANMHNTYKPKGMKKFTPMTQMLDTSKMMAFTNSMGNKNN